MLKSFFVFVCIYLLKKIDNIHKILMTNIDRDCKQERSATVRNWILWRLSYPELYCFTFPLFSVPVNID